jgi:hypothetical protein
VNEGDVCVVAGWDCALRDVAVVGVDVAEVLMLGETVTMNTINERVSNLDAKKNPGERSAKQGRCYSIRLHDRAWQIMGTHWMRGMWLG